MKSESSLHDIQISCWVALRIWVWVAHGKLVLSILEFKYTHWRSQSPHLRSIILILNVKYYVTIRIISLMIDAIPAIHHGSMENHSFQFRMMDPQINPMIILFQTSEQTIFQCLGDREGSPQPLIISWYPVIMLPLCCVAAFSYILFSHINNRWPFMNHGTHTIQSIMYFSKL